MQRQGPRYRVEREIGRGAFGVVYLARDNVLGRSVALKVLSVPEGLGAEEKAHLVERFHREARAAARLSHVNIVTIHDISRAGERNFISMEYLEGQPLSRVISGEPLPLDRAVSIAGQVLAGLDYAHSRDVVHRDIKPDNIFILRDDAVKLVDFGLARIQASTTLTGSGIVMGSPGYIAPEVVQGRTADARTDIFSFGAVFYEMLTGVRPFGPSTPDESLVQVIYRIMSEEPPPPSSLNPRVPTALDEITQRCLAKDPETRFQNARDIRNSLQHEAGGVAGDENGSGARVPVEADEKTDTTAMASSPTLLDDREREAAPVTNITESVVVGWEAGSAVRGGRSRRVRRSLWAAAMVLGAGLAVLILLLFLYPKSTATEVPNLINLGASQAGRALDKAGLRKGNVSEGFSYDIWKGKVMRQMPGAGTEVERNSTVDFVVSLGQDVAQIPDVVNMQADVAERTLRNFGFTVRRESGYRAGVQVGHVFEERPAAGTLKDSGFEVTIMINSGEPIPPGDVIPPRRKQ